MNDMEFPKKMVCAVGLNSPMVVVEGIDGARLLAREAATYSEMYQTRCVCVAVGSLTSELIRHNQGESFHNSPFSTF